MVNNLSINGGLDITVEIDFNRTGDFDHPLSNVSNYVRDSLFFSSGWFNVGQVESNVAAHVAPVNSMRLILDNQDRTFSYEYLNSELHNQLSSGLMVRLTVSRSGISYSWSYFTKTIKEPPGEFGSHTVIVDCVCAMPRVQRANYEPLVTQNISTSDALRDMMESAILMTPYTSGFFVIDGSMIDGPALIFDAATDVTPIIEFEEGLSTLDYVGDVLYRDRKQLSVQKAQLFIADMCMAEAYGRFYYQPRDGKFYFHNRYHDRVQTPTITLSSSEYVDAKPISTPVFNDISLHYQPRDIGLEDSILFLSDSVPITLQSGKHRQLRVRFSNPDNKLDQVASLAITDPVAGSDIIVTNGEGQNLPFIYRSADLKGAGGTLYFYNDIDITVTIDKVQIRGTPIILPQPEIAKAQSGSSMVTYNWLPMPDLKGSYITDPEFAQNVIDFLLLRHSTMHRVMESVSIIITDDNFVDIMAITIGDVIILQDSWSGHNKEYVVLGETHTYDISRQLWKVLFSLRSNDITPYFIIDTSVIDGTDIIGY